MVKPTSCGRRPDVYRQFPWISLMPDNDIRSAMYVCAAECLPRTRVEDEEHQSRVLLFVNKMQLMPPAG